MDPSKNSSEIGIAATEDSEYTHSPSSLDIGAGVVVLAVSPVTVIANCLLLASVCRFNRLRTPSNYLVFSLAASDLGVGLALLVGTYMRLTDSGPCLLFYSIFISLCGASIMVIAGIAVDRFMSLAQPLRYNDLITHKSVCMSVPCCWIYSFFMGFLPSIYHSSLMKPLSQYCSFFTSVDSEVQMALLLGLYWPCCLVVVGCYAYTYVIARAHARAIYTVQVSLNGTRQLAVSRYGQTLAITVGCFLLLWLPLQMCMILDLTGRWDALTCGTSLTLSLPIFFGSAVNPWVYGLRNTDIRFATHKLIEGIFRKYTATSSHWYPEITRTNCDVAELNSFASHMRLCANSNPTASMVIAPRHMDPEKTCLLVVPVDEISLQLVVTSNKICDQCAEVEQSSKLVIM